MRSIGLYAFIAAYCLSIIVLTAYGKTLTSLVWLGGCVAASALFAVRARVPLGPSSLSIAAGFLIALARLSMVPTDMPAVFVRLLDHPTTATGVVVSLPDLRETSEKITVETRSGSGHMRFLATVPLYPAMHVGDEVRVSGTLSLPAAFETDGGRTFAYDKYLQKDAIYAVMPAARAAKIGESHNLWLQFLRVLERIKLTLTRALSEALPEPESSLAVGILVGGKQGLGTRLIDDFTKSGMLQIIVLSGFNVMIVANALVRLLTHVPKKASFIVALASILSFVLLAGAGSSAVRAGLMAAFALAARTFERRYDVMRIVCISLLLIALWNPLTLAYDPGFQFSFTATIGLVIGTPLIAPWLLFLRSVLLIELFATTLAAEIALLPLLLWETGNLSIVSVFANVAAMPAVPFAMAASAFAAVLAIPLNILSPVAAILVGAPAYLPLAYVIQVATLSASLPFANRILPVFPFGLVLAAYATLAGLVFVLSKPPRRESGSPRRSSSGSPGTRQHTFSSQPVCSQP